jgi:myb proto-oncogene protein
MDVQGNGQKTKTSTLKDAVQTHGVKKWGAIAALVPGRVGSQCRHRWQHVLDANTDRANGRTGKWAKDEDTKLTDAVRMHGGKDWGAIAALVPGRTKKQCWSRWNEVLDANIDQANRWASDEDTKLKDAVQTLGDKDWVAISALIPGRTKKRCKNRWYNCLHLSIDRANEHQGSWTLDEDIKLKCAIQAHGDNNWKEVTALVPGRTERQCWSRWNEVSNANIDRANIRTGKWAKDEDINLQAAVQTHGVKDWVTIATLVPGRTKKTVLGQME